MEAALWGRIESVKALLSVNVDKGFRDREGRCAMDLAQPAPKNEMERSQRSPYAAAEGVPKRDRDKRHIIVLLGDSNTEKQHRYTGPLSESERNKYSFRKSRSEMAITLHGPSTATTCHVSPKLPPILDWEINSLEYQQPVVGVPMLYCTCSHPL